VRASATRAGGRPGGARHARTAEGTGTSERGITLIELVVVVAIIAVLVAIALVLFQEAQARARLAADQGTLNAMRSAITIYYGKHNGNFPATPGVYVSPSPPNFQCSLLVYSYDSATGLISVTSSNTAADCP
jgi:prepilin-type N-terminal cleavage/methylation domain-containing protein